PTLPRKCCQLDIKRMAFGRYRQIRVEDYSVLCDDQFRILKTAEIMKIRNEQEYNEIKEIRHPYKRNIELRALYLKQFNEKCTVLELELLDNFPSQSERERVELLWQY